ncbi:MAG TPA: hypothetical protein VG982_01780 [Candidatus Paceibacterota bacterium]|nr:hypothetical protein [Candidatus Paceibacterota bacterium]
MAVAEVNIQNAHIASQEGNTFHLSFSLTNGKGVQAGVHYSVQLVPASSPQTVADEKDYDETLVLAENSTTNRDIVYEAPAALSGAYVLYIVGGNDSGFPLGIASIDNVTLSGTSGVAIAPETCRLNTSKQSPGTATTASGIVVGSGQSLYLSCTITNTSTSSITVTPSFVIKSRGAYGALAKTSAPDTSATTLAAGAKKSVTIAVPVAADAGLYKGFFSLVVGTDKSNTIPFAYSRNGISATVVNISPDKDRYHKGETAKLSVLWNGSGVFTPMITATITNVSGGSCGTATMQATGPGMQDVMVPITSACVNPQITVALAGADGTALAQKSVAVPSSPLKLFSSAWGGLLLLVILIVAVVVLMAIKKRLGRKTISALALFVVVGLTPFVHAHATTFFLNSDVMLNLGIDSTVYNQGDHIKVNAQVSNSSGTTTYPISLSAVTVNNSSVQLFGGSVTLAPGQNVIDNTKQFNAPSTGNYTVDFTAGVNGPIYVKVADTDDDGYRNLPTESSCPGGDGRADVGWTNHYNYYNVTETVSFFSDPTATTPLDVSGLGLKLKLQYYDIPSDNGFGYPPPSPFGSPSMTAVNSGTSYSYLGANSYYMDYTLHWGSSSCDQEAFSGVVSNGTASEQVTYALLDGSDLTVPYIILPPIPTTNISANPQYFYDGTSVTVSWSSQYANSCTGSGFSTSGNTSGYATVTPSATTTYSLTCTNLAGSNTDSVTLTDLGSPPPPSGGMCNEWPGISQGCLGACVPDPSHTGYEICQQ